MLRTCPEKCRSMARGRQQVIRSQHHYRQLQCNRQISFASASSCLSSTPFSKEESRNTGRRSLISQRPFPWTRPNWNHHDRFRIHLFSSAPAGNISKLSTVDQPIRILYASQGGTAQIFAQQLEEELEDDFPNVDISMESWKEAGGANLLTPGDALHVFLVSVTGVGEPPDNGREFYEYLTAASNDNDDDLAKNVEYVVFGLGNSKAHPNHYNVIGMSVDEKLHALGGSRIMEIGLGDDGDCIEDDFDQWILDFKETLAKAAQPASNDSEETASEQGGDGGVDDDSPPESDIKDNTIIEEVKVDKLNIPMTSCLIGVSKTTGATMRLKSDKYPTLQLQPPSSDLVHDDLFHLQDTSEQFYSDTTYSHKVLKNRALSLNGGETGLHEIQIELPASASSSYETGDHLMVYPRNSQTIVEAYLNLLDVDPHAIIQGIDETTAQGNEDTSGTTSKYEYPYPKGITVFETLSHCVDLGATPSPAFARFLLGRKDINYKDEIANPRRTPLDLLLSKKSTSETDDNNQHARISLEDLLFNLSPMKTRYYSIASSSTKDPSKVTLVFRPVRYTTSMGMLREGVCTSYMAHKGVKIAEEDRKYAHIAASLNSNPSFRLPNDPSTPILMVAGGCGVAPIRAFTEERIAQCQLGQGNQDKFGPGLLYVGFRHPNDLVYQEMFQQADDVGALTNVKTAVSWGCSSTDDHHPDEPNSDGLYCMHVPDLVRLDGKIIWDHLESGGHTYLCGGARTFGAAIEHQFMEIIQEHGNTDLDGAVQYLRNLIQEGRLLEDLAD